MVNGLRFSLRRYVLWTLLGVAGVMITLFSVQSTDSFFDGMDGMLRGTMVRAGAAAEVQPGAPEQVLNFFIAARHEDLPDEVKARFQEHELEPLTLLKEINKPSWFRRPDSAHFLMMVPLANGEVRYVSQTFAAPPVETPNSFRIPHEIANALIGLAALAAFAVVLLLVMRSVSRPIESLRQWAAGLDEKKLDEPIPAFRYQELDALAAIIHHSLQNVTATLEREREFVNHASHELRTPIAVIRSSVELLCRVVDVENGKGRNAVARIDSASKTMTDLTETLLWLGRSDAGALPVSRVDVADMVDQLCNDLSYLLTGKSVSVTRELGQCQLALPETASRIIIGNLIRNAYQHTQHGEVSIALSGNQLTVVNRETGAEAETVTHANETDDTGYGLGLRLIDRLTAKLGWTYSPIRLPGGYAVTLTIH